MEIHEALSFYHSRVKYVTLQELLANNTPIIDQRLEEKRVSSLS